MTSTPSTPGRWLSAADRCDRCGARGYMLAVLRDGDLVFCAHHARQYAEGLAATAVFVYDESDELLAA